LELSAGIAGVIKVLLQLKHKTLVKTLHCDTINPYIQLNDSPFYILQEAREWNALQDEEGKDLPRRAGVSSFGFGGANAHVVIEEYIPGEKVRPRIDITSQNPAIIVLSAKNGDRLNDQVRQLLAAIREQQFSGFNLADVAFTLQVGREAMEERLALRAGSIKELVEKLEGFEENRDDLEDFYRGQVKRNKETLSIFAADEELQEAVDKWIQRGKYDKLLDLWVKGLNFDWHKLYGDIKPRRISLPTYPFARERYWVPWPEAKPTGSGAAATPDIAVQSALLPVLAVESGFSNISDRPGKISLQSLSDHQTLPDKPKPPGQTQQKATLSLIKTPLRQPAVNSQSKPAPSDHRAVSLPSLREELTKSLAEALSMNQSDIDVDDKFVDIGLDSITGVEWIQWVNKHYGASIPATKVYDYPSVREFAVFLEKEISKLFNQIPNEPTNPVSGPFIDRDALPPVALPATGATAASGVSAPEPAAAPGQSRPWQLSISVESLQEELTASLAEALSMRQSDIDADDKFVDIGLDSITGVEWIQSINKQYGASIAATKVYDYPCIREFSVFVEKELRKQRKESNQKPVNTAPSLTFDTILQQVQSGILDIDQADELLNYILKGEQNEQRSYF